MTADQKSVWWSVYLFFSSLDCWSLILTSSPFEKLGCASGSFAYIACPYRAVWGGTPVELCGGSCFQFLFQFLFSTFAVMQIRLMFLMNLSHIPLASGHNGVIFLCCIPMCWTNLETDPELNGGPLSVWILAGIWCRDITLSRCGITDSALLEFTISTSRNLE